MKLAKRIVLGIVALLIIGGTILFFSIDSIARSQVERGARESMDVATTLRAAKLSIFAGGFDMDDLHVSNPEGYASDHFLTLGKGSLQVTLGTLLQDNVHLPTLQLEDLSIILEKTGTESNLDVIMANIGRTRDPNARERRYQVDEVVIRNVTLSVIMPPLSNAEKPIVVRVPEIRLREVGSDSESGVVLSQLTGTIIAATVRAIAENAPDVLPNLVTATLEGALAKAGDLGKLGGELGAEAAQIIGTITGDQEAIQELLKGDPSRAIEGIGTGLEETGRQVEEGARDAIRGLLPGSNRDND